MLQPFIYIVSHRSRVTSYMKRFPFTFSTWTQLPPLLVFLFSLFLALLKRLWPFTDLICQWSVLYSSLQGASGGGASLYAALCSCLSAACLAQRGHSVSFECRLSPATSCWCVIWGEFLFLGCPKYPRQLLQVMVVTGPNPPSRREHGKSRS